MRNRTETPSAWTNRNCAQRDTSTGEKSKNRHTASSSSSISSPCGALISFVERQMQDSRGEKRHWKKTPKRAGGATLRFRVAAPKTVVGSLPPVTLAACRNRSKHFVMQSETNSDEGRRKDPLALLKAPPLSAGHKQLCQKLVID